MTEDYKFIYEKCGSPTIEKSYFDGFGHLVEDVIPSEITLAHVLLALRDHSIYLRASPEFSANENNLYVIKSWKANAYWDLTKTLSEQSLETQQAIAKLLGKEG